MLAVMMVLVGRAVGQWMRWGASGEDGAEVEGDKAVVIAAMERSGWWWMAGQQGNGRGEWGSSSAPQQPNFGPLRQ